MMIIPPDLMSETDRQLLNDNGICVVVAQDPGKVRFVDPLPVVSSRSQIEQAAIQLSRKLLNRKVFNTDWSGEKEVSWIIAQAFAQLLTIGTPLSGEPTQAELEQKVYDETKLQEMRVLAKEDARADHLRQKTLAAEAVKSQVKKLTREGTGR